MAAAKPRCWWLWLWSLSEYPRRLRRFGLSRHPTGCSVRPGEQAIRTANRWAARTAGGAWSRSAAESRGTAAASEEEAPLSRHSNGDEGSWVIPTASAVQLDNRHKGTIVPGTRKSRAAAQSGSKSQLAAVRDVGLCEDRNGSFSTDPQRLASASMSVLRPEVERKWRRKSTKMPRGPLPGRHAYAVLGGLVSADTNENAPSVPAWSTCIRRQWCKFSGSGLSRYTIAVASDCGAAASGTIDDPQESTPGHL
jgi:hypothetical protein